MAEHHVTHKAGEHHGIGRYVAVYMILIAATILTVVTGRMNLGSANIYLAMFIATTKATLVVLFFMHLWDMGGVNRLVFVVSVLFLVVLILGVFGDLMTRPAITLPNMGPVTAPAGAVPAAPAGH